MVMLEDPLRIREEECKAAVGYYGLCAVSGMLSAGITHLAITPLDVLKVNMQVLVSFILLDWIGMLCNLHLFSIRAFIKYFIFVLLSCR